MKYRTIVADPPWPIAWSSGGSRKAGGWNARDGVGVRHDKLPMPYALMTVEAIMDLPVSELADADAHLYLWIPDRFLLEGVAAQVCRAWGFKPSRTLIWHKTNFGLGTFPRPQHETIVIAKRGHLDYRVCNVGSVQTWRNPRDPMNGNAKIHSAKPEGAMDLIEQASPGPYVELFSRRHRLGWDVWGDESANTAQLDVTA